MTDRVCKGEDWHSGDRLSFSRLLGCLAFAGGRVMDLGPGKPSAFTLTWVLGHSSHGPSPASSSPCAPAGTPAWQGSSSVPEMLTHFLRRAEGNCADRALRCHTPPAWLSVCFCSLRRCDAVQQQPCAEWGQTALRVACPRPSGAHRQLQHRSSSGW